jgi:predicted ATP-dependent Lon-type protease
MIGVSEAYIAFFEAQICDIGTRSIPKLVASQHLTNPSPQNFRTKTFFDFLHELLAADSNTSPPLTIMNVVAVSQ